MSNRDTRHSTPAARAGLSRRTVLAGGAALGASMLAMPAVIRAQQGGRVFVRTAGGSYQEALEKGTWSKFTEMTGIEVVPVPANTAKLLAMAETGDGQLELVEANATAILTLHSKDALFQMRAAISLGASPLQAFRLVTLPAIMPGVLSGGLFAFLTSFDELMIPLFLGGPDTQTLAVCIWNSVVLEIEPTIAAVSSVLIALAIAVLVLAGLAQRWGRRIRSTRGTA